MNLKKSAWVCFFGMLFGFALLYMFTLIDLGLIEKVDFTKEYSIEELQKRARRMNWRSEYLFYPTAFALVGLFISVLDRSKYRTWLVIVGLLPLTLVISPYFILDFSLRNPSISLRNLSIVFLYFAIALAVSYLVPVKATLPIKRVKTCFYSIVLGSLLIDIFTYIDHYLIEGFLVEIIKANYDKVEMYECVIRPDCRFRYLYFPTVYASMGLITSILDRSKHRMWLTVIVVLPISFGMFISLVKAFSLYNLSIVFVYFAIALVVSYLAPLKKSDLHNKLWKQENEEN